MAGQLGAYTVLARLDPAGVSRRTWEAQVDGEAVRIVHPGNWTVEPSPDERAAHVSLRGPAGVRMEVYGSRALKAVTAAPEDEQASGRSPLERAHAALEGVARRGLARYSEGRAVSSGALGRESLLSFYSAEREGVAVRGFRHTCIGEQRVWSVQGECPARIWGRTAPVLDALVRQMELP